MGVWVHLDFKGAPPSTQYLMDLLPWFKSLKIQGLILEWEDMLPYNGPLKVVCHPRSYGTGVVEQFTARCNDLGLETIPLVQTFGHLQHLLVHKPWLRESCSFCVEHPEHFSTVLQQFKERRFVGRDGDVLYNSLEGCFTTVCPQNPAALEIVLELIQQTLKFHPHSRTVHLGFDEARIKTCSACSGKERIPLVTSHLKSVIQGVKELNLRVKRVLIWNDMFRDWGRDDVENLRAEIGRVGGDLQLEIVVWAYGKNVHQVVDQYQHICAMFTTWGASSFRAGMWGHDLIPPTELHRQNIRCWRQQNVRDLLLTGWAKSHSGRNLNCELLPASLPNLCMCISEMTGNNVDENMCPGWEFFEVARNVDDVRREIKRARELEMGRGAVDKVIAIQSRKLAELRPILLGRAALLFHDARDIVEIVGKVDTLEKQLRWMKHHRDPLRVGGRLPNNQLAVDRSNDRLYHLPEVATVFDGWVYTATANSVVITRDGGETGRVDVPCQVVGLHHDGFNLFIQTAQTVYICDSMTRRLVELEKITDACRRNEILYCTACNNVLYVGTRRFMLSYNPLQLKMPKLHNKPEEFSLSSFENIRAWTHTGDDSLLVVCDDNLTRIPLTADGHIPTQRKFPSCVIGRGGWNGIDSIVATPDLLYARRGGETRKYPLH